MILPYWKIVEIVVAILFWGALLFGGLWVLRNVLQGFWFGLV